MSQIEEQLTEQFRKWELRGRGWQVFPEPVYPEPPFVPFYGHYLPDTPAFDDGRKPTILSSFVRKLSQTLSTERPAPPVIVEPEEEPEPMPYGACTEEHALAVDCSRPGGRCCSRVGNVFC